MKIEFKKISHKVKFIELHFDQSTHSDFAENEYIDCLGELVRENEKLVKFTGKMSGNLILTCIKTGEDYSKAIDEELALYFSDGIWKTQSQSNSIDSLDVIEFFEGFIDFDFVLESEIESMRLDYNIKE